MLNAADVRKINMGLIRAVMWKGGAHTKQSIALDTGLSAATCNTMLNEMERMGEISGVKQQLHGVGRSTSVYRLNEKYESILCIRYDMCPDGSRVIQCDVLSMLGTIVYSENQYYDRLDPLYLGEKIEEVIKKQENISCIIIGTNGFLDQGRINVSDIPEMEGVPLWEIIQKKNQNLPTKIIFDMHCYAYGAYKAAGYTTEIMTFYHCPKYHLPGSATIMKGMIIEGKNGFAGLTGYLSRDISQEEQIRLSVQNPSNLRHIEEAVLGIITLLNPDEIVFAGDAIDNTGLETICKACENQIPNQFLPRFRKLNDDGEDYYLEGMYQMAVQMKTNIASGWQKNNY